MPLNLKVVTTTNITPMAVSSLQKGSENNSSFDTPSYDATTKKLTRVLITGIILPEASTMNVAHYESKYHDSGFYTNIDFEFTKIKGSQTNVPLSGAEFKLDHCTHVHDPTCNGLDAQSSCIHKHDTLTSASTTKNSFWAMENPTTRTSGIDGKVTFTNLKYGDFMLVETKSVEGYQFPAGCWKLTTNLVDKTVTIVSQGKPPAFINKENAYYLPNYTKTTLPVMGSTGAPLFVLCGTALVSLSLFWCIHLFNKNKKIK